MVATTSRGAAVWAILQGKSCGPYLSASAMRFVKRRYLMFGLYLFLSLPPGPFYFSAPVHRSINVPNFPLFQFYEMTNGEEGSWAGGDLPYLRPNAQRDPSVSKATFGQLLKTHLFSAYQHV